VEPGNLCNVLKVIKLDQVAIFNSVFCSNMLMLVVEVLSPLGKSNGREAFSAKTTVVATAKISIQSELHHRLKRLEPRGLDERRERRGGGSTNSKNFAGQFAGWVSFSMPRKSCRAITSAGADGRMPCERTRTNEFHA
jgi:hypothetical protein